MPVKVEQINEYLFSDTVQSKKTGDSVTSIMTLKDRKTREIRLNPGKTVPIRPNQEQRRSITIERS